MVTENQQPSALLRRRFNLLHALSEQQLALLTGLSGVRQFAQKGTRLSLRYDACQLALADLLSWFDQQGIELKQSRWQHWRLQIYNFVDTNAAENARRQNSHCCNRPPPGAGH